MKNIKKAFTLVELVVVIVILSVLAAISVMSFLWYTENSRDSARISDLANIHKLLELYKIENWAFPIPTNWVPVTYSGSVVWVQWTFWDTILDRVKNSWVELLDPLTENEYSYSLLNTFNDYQLWTIMESNNSRSKFLWFSKQDSYAYLDGNFNWFWARTFTWGINYIFALPSITASYFWENADLVDIVQNNWLVYNWYENLPYAYVNSKFNVLEWASTINWLTYENMWIYTTNDLGILTKMTEESDTQRIDLLWNLQEAYTWTIVSSTKPLTSVYSVSVEEPTMTTKEVAINVVNKLLSSTISSTMSSFALLPYDGWNYIWWTSSWGWTSSWWSTSSGWAPSPYTISFSESDWQTYLCSSCF